MLDVSLLQVTNHKIFTDLLNCASRAEESVPLVLFSKCGACWPITARRVAWLPSKEKRPGFCTALSGWRRGLAGSVLTMGYPSCALSQNHASDTVAKLVPRNEILPGPTLPRPFRLRRYFPRNRSPSTALRMRSTSTCWAMRSRMSWIFAVSAGRVLTVRSCTREATR